MKEPWSAGSLVANGAWALASAREAAAFRRALDDPGRAQEELLLSIVRRNAETAFGRAMRFDRIRSSEEYRERVPLSNYADYAPFVDRIRAGEEDVLTSERVERLVPTSGSTSARKLIPFTRSLRDEFRRAIAPWVSDLFARDPELLCGPSYWSISPALQEAREEGAVPVGFDDDSEYLGRGARALVAKSLAVPPAVRSVADVDRFRMVTLLFLLRARALRLVSVWHPSFLVLLLRFMAERWDELLRHLADGLRDAELDEASAATIARGEPRLARELASCDPGRPDTVWPRLGHVSCWGDGQAAGAAAELARLLPRAAIVPKGLLATEAFVSLPFGGARPLAVRSHYMEFLDDAGSVHGAGELREGEAYEVVVTTGGGLYRYRLRDLVRVDGFVGRTPSVVFVGRSDRVSDLRGEKLSESFVAAALARAFGGEGNVPHFAMLAPEEDGGAARYVLFVSGEPSEGGEVAARLEAELCANPHYDWARRLGQLGPVGVARVGRGAHEAVVAELARRGQLLGGIKASCLRTETGWRARLPEAGRDGVEA